MPTMPCQYRLTCEDALLTNYTSEGAEPFPPYYAVVYPPLNPPPLDQEWSMPGCLYICKSYISQEDANLCALRQSILCIDGPPTDEVWYSAPATCTATCPDGTIFYYTVPAGMFIAKTYAAALAQAQEYACLKAQEERFCIQDLPRCACAGAAYSGTITTDIGKTGLTWTVIGALPPGLQLISTSTSATIYGTPILKGTYAFQVAATDANGNYAIKTFTIQVIEITTTALTNFVIGAVYSFQLTADGGSGNYTWRVAIGTLPDGLSLSTTGLISGTPTALATGGTLTFEVVDTTCESATRQFFTPRIALVTVGTTTIKTKRGWAEYQASTGALYKKITVSGELTQTGLTAPLDVPSSLGGEFCGGAKYVYSGYSEIDIYGNLISQHRKDLSVACSKEYPPAQSVSIVNGVAIWGYTNNITTFLGYCWDDDPGSCTPCSAVESSWSFAGNYALASQHDYPTNMVMDGNNLTVTPTSYSYTGTALSDYKALSNVQNFPEGTVAGVINTIRPWMSMESTGTFSLVLSDEYTDANATASAVVYTNNSKIAENLPNYLSYLIGYRSNIASRTTSVAYVLNMTNLVAGEDYIASVELWSSLGGHITVQTAFTSAGTTHQVIGTVPTPAANSTITVKNPKVIYAP